MHRKRCFDVVVRLADEVVRVTGPDRHVLPRQRQRDLGHGAAGLQLFKVRLGRLLSERSEPVEIGRAVGCERRFAGIATEDVADGSVPKNRIGGQLADFADQRGGHGLAAADGWHDRVSPAIEGDHAGACRRSHPNPIPV